MDLHAELAALLALGGISPADTGGAITFEGADPVLDSVFPLGAIAALARMAPSAAAAAIWRARSGRGQDLACHLGQVVHELQPQPTINGIAVNSLNTKSGHFNGYNQNFVPTRDGRQVSMASVYAGIRDRLAELIGVLPHQAEAIRDAVAQWDAAALEDAAAAVGAVLVMVRSEAEWRASPQGQALASAPVVELTRIGDAPPEPLGPALRPLGGMRAIGMGRMLVGAALAMTLAEHGADVINLWAPEDTELQQAYLKGHLGMRPVLVRDTTPEGLALIRSLVAGSDIVFENRRAGAAERRGLDAASCAAARPGIIHVSLRCYGHVGPWADRAGFDPQALSATGCAVSEGDAAAPRYPPTRIVNDWVAAWLGAFGAMAALLRRAQQGGSWRVRVSLARSSMWWLGLPRPGGAPRLAPAEPRYYAAATPLGHYRGIACQIRFSETQPHFETVLTPWGAGQPAWRPR